MEGVQDAVGLEDFNYQGNPNCKYNKIPTAQESINQIYKILGKQEKIWK